MLIHAFLKCIINLLALKTAVLFSVNQITKTLLIMTNVRKLCLFQVWFPVSLCFSMLDLYLQYFSFEMFLPKKLHVLTLKQPSF